jgi:hypothetical protein
MHLQSLNNQIKLLLFLCFFGCTQTKAIKNPSPSEKCDFKVSFELKSDSIWQVPLQGQQTQVSCLLEMTNLGDTAIRFPIMDKFRLSVLSPAGTELPMSGGQDELIPGKPVSDPISTGEKYILKLQAELVWNSNSQLQLKLKDAFGSTWFIGPLKSGTNTLMMFYENLPKGPAPVSGLWCGIANIIPLPIELTD